MSIIESKHFRDINFNRRGSISIFLVVILACLIFIVSLYVNLAGLYAGRSIAEASFEAGGRSILSEYNRELFKDYGIFAFSSYEDEVERKLYKYTVESLENIKGINAIRLNINSIDASLKSHSIININAFEKEVIKQMKILAPISYFKDIEKNTIEFKENTFVIQLIENSKDVFDSIQTIGEIGIQINDNAKSIIDQENLLLTELSKPKEKITISKINILSKRIKKEYSQLTMKLDGINVEIKKFNDALIKLNAFLISNNKETINESGKIIKDNIYKAENLIRNLEKYSIAETKRKLSSNVKILNNVAISIQELSKDELKNINIKNYFKGYYYSKEILTTLATEFIVSKNSSESGKIKNIKNKSISRSNIPIKSKNRVLRNEIIINGLPSREILNKSKNETIKINDFKIFDQNFSLTENILNDLMLSEYILVYLKNNQDKERVNGKTFFNNEAEYVLYGSYSDDTNFTIFKLNFLALRTSLNLIHIYSDNIKLSQIKSLALIITPGPWSLGTEFLIATAWASFEASKDLELIINAGKVPLIKTKLSWQTDFDGFLKGKFNNLNSENTNEGLNYKEYLRLLLLLEGRNNKIARTMDIIQINMMGRYNEKFNLKEHYTGYSFKTVITKEEVLPLNELFGFYEFVIEGEQLY
jgi:hypothetical protein